MQSPYLMMHLLRAVYWFDEALQASLKEAGIPNVSRAQSMLIANVAAGEQRATRIARNLGVTRQAVSLMLNELEARGIVELVADPNDGRARIVHIAEQGNETRDAAAKAFQYLELKLVERIGLPAYHGLRDAIRLDWGEPPRVPPEVLEEPEHKEAGAGASSI